MGADVGEHKLDFVLSLLMQLFIQLFLDVWDRSAGARGEIDVDIVANSRTKHVGEDTASESAGSNRLKYGELVDPAYCQDILDLLSESLRPPGYLLAERQCATKVDIEHPTQGH